MKNTDRPRHSYLRAMTCGLLLSLCLPSAATATEGTAAPIPADADPDCEESTIELEIDVATGIVYLIDPDTGTATATDSNINVYFGDLGHVLLMLHYTSSEWNVSVTADGGLPVTYGTTNGWLRYSLSDDVDEYVFDSSEAAATSAMNMTPIIPDIKILTHQDCPPST